MFHSARLKLTAWYLLIIMCVSVSFSIVIYRNLARELDRFSRRITVDRILREQVLIPSIGPVPPIPNEELIEEFHHRLIITLIIINGAILVLAGGLGYILAGQTLLPIKNMIDEQNRFISDASHEFRTPLTALKSTMEVALRDNKLTIAEARTILKENMGDVNKLQSLSDSLLQLSQYQKPLDALVFGNVKVQLVVANAVRSVTHAADAKHITIKSQVPASTVWGNGDSLTELLVILLDNAIKYSKNDTTISVTAEKSMEEVVLSVSDHGIGIAAKDIPKIFDRFYRADKARTSAANSGYGLGLSIAKKIVTAHHGTISVKSAPGKGTEFLIRLPVTETA